FDVIVCQIVEHVCWVLLLKSSKSILQTSASEFLLGNLFFAVLFPIQLIDGFVNRQKSIECQRNSVFFENSFKSQSRIAIKIPKGVIQIKKNVSNLMSLCEHFLMLFN